MKKTAEDYLGEDSNRSCYYLSLLTSTMSQRQATKDAGRIAGLEVKAYHQRAELLLHLRYGDGQE